MVVPYRHLILLTKTGQTTSYYAGDDASYKAGAAVPNRFRDNGNGSITDHATGLTWLVDTKNLITPAIPGVSTPNFKNANWAINTHYYAGDVVKALDPTFSITVGFICKLEHTSGASGTLFTDPQKANRWQRSCWWQTSTAPDGCNWYEALTAVESLTALGYSDWRLPNAREALSIANYGSVNCRYPGFPTWPFHTGTTSPSNTANQFVMGVTLTSDMQPPKEWPGAYILPVRGGIYA